MSSHPNTHGGPHRRTHKKRSSGRRLSVPVFLCAVFSVIVVSIILSGTVNSALEKYSHQSARKKQTRTASVEKESVPGITLQSVQQKNKADGEDAKAADPSDESSSETPDTSTSPAQPDDRAADLAVRAGDPPAVLDNPDDVKTVYLTFDDGPSQNTPKVLDILDKYEAKATFFVIGVNTDYLHYIKEAYDKGHTIGLHTFTHDYASLYASDEAYLNDLAKIGETVKEQIGYIPAFVRFPGGASNTVSASYCAGIVSRMAEKLHELGYQYYDWNVSSGDGSGGLTADQIIAHSQTEQFNKVMILFHDSATKDSTVEALPKIIEYYKERGYVFRAIDRSSIAIQHGIAN